MELRPARAEDVAALAALVPARPPTWWAELVDPAAPIPPVVIATDGDGVVEGLVAIETDGGRGTVTHLVVAPEHRRRGRGRKLLLCAERMLARSGCDHAITVLDAGTGSNPDSGWGTDTDTDTGSGSGAEVAGAFLRAHGWRLDGAGRQRWQIDLDGDGAVRDHVLTNRWNWDDEAAAYEGPGRRAFQPERRANPTWGCWGVPESEVGMLRDVAGREVIELGCGTGYVSAYCLEAGARSVVGLDNSPAQLATARSLQAEFDMAFPLLLGNAEATPFPDGSFDFAISEYGAAIWCDPHKWLPEAARLLRPGGRLVFLGNSVAAMLCVLEFEAEGAATPTMLRPQRGMHRFTWFDNVGVEFHISHGDMIRLLRRSGFDVLDLVELYIPEGATSDVHFVDEDWGRRWPVEEVWLAERRP